MSSDTSAAIPRHIDDNRSAPTNAPKMGAQDNRARSVTIGSATLYLGDSAEVLPSISSADACVTDPPYGLDYMGKAWDRDVPDADLWQKVLNAVKPGAHLLSFFGSRTYHRGAVQIEEAGFEIRDQIMWLYGSGFPKSHDVSKAIDKALGAKREIVGDHVPLGFNRLLAEHGARTINVTQFARTSDRPVTEEARQWQGWGTALKPAHEPIVLARKPLSEKSVAANVMKWGAGSINIDECRVELPANDHLHTGIVRDGHALDTAQGEGSWGFKAVDRRAGLGRFPANVIHDNSDEVVRQLSDTLTGKDRARYFYAAKASPRDRHEGLEDFAGTISSSFQTANATSGRASPMGVEKTATRARANCHPTVKPTDLMRYLCRLVTPLDGVVLDPFMGSGSTGKAALLEGFQFIGVERDPKYFEIACARIAHAQGIKWRRMAA